METRSGYSSVGKEFFQILTFSPGIGTLSYLHWRHKTKYGSVIRGLLYNLYGWPIGKKIERPYLSKGRRYRALTHRHGCKNVQWTPTSNFWINFEIKAHYEIPPISSHDLITIKQGKLGSIGGFITNQFVPCVVKEDKDSVNARHPVFLMMNSLLQCTNHHYTTHLLL